MNGLHSADRSIATSISRTSCVGTSTRQVMYHIALSMMMICGVPAMHPVRAESLLPTGASPKPLDAPHFPDRLHTFVWRNWESADLSDMARVLGTTQDKVREIGESMGLPPQVPISDLQRQRGYISLIRRNWHLLNYDQLLALLGWDAEKLAYTLKEDDFLWHKLGSLKPDCPPLRYDPPSEAAQQRCAEIKTLVRTHFGQVFARPAQPRFAFLDDLSRPAPDDTPPPMTDGAPIRFLYSYFAVFGDPLLDARLNPYPDGLLQRLASLGVNGVWLHVVLRDLAPSKDFPEFGKGHETRLANLRQLVQRARKHGVKVYLYMNEPRSMPSAFFKDRADIAGVREGDNTTMCTSTQQVRQFLVDSLAYVFREVPDLGGVFTITASENLTSCASHYQEASCPRCSKRSGAEVIADVNAAIAEGVRKGNPKATVICWDWGWKNEWAEEIIRRLPDNVYFMSVSEWDLPIERGGVKTIVGEYSISSVGPGPRAQRHWKWARQRGLTTMAKVQVNCTWELSAVPYLPVMNLVARHMENLSRLGVRDLMLSWSLGGYPSPNLRLVREFSKSPTPTAEEALSRVAEERYGKGVAPEMLKAWETFSRAFEEYPYNSPGLYSGPFQLGPANPLYLTATGYRATMVGFPYDCLDAWRGPYPADVYVSQCEKIAKGFETGIEQMRLAQAKADTDSSSRCIAEDLRLAEAACIYFRSVANQARFVLNRNASKEPRPVAHTSAAEIAESIKLITEQHSVIEEEIRLASQMYDLTRTDARIGYEASNHYYYLPLDLVEKVINCQHILDSDKMKQVTIGKDLPK
ncbi:MAG: alpha-amylase family protein [Phycisphaerae bacterium]|nr:alpha-amylase family protein [Phycisphaerae bacterium]